MIRNCFSIAAVSAFAALTLGSMGFSARASAADGATVRLRDGLDWVEVTCGTSTLNFVVDTGAARSCIDLRAAKRLGLPLGTSTTVAGVDGMATAFWSEGFHASAAGMPLPGKVLAFDLSGPSRGCWQRIDGLIGADFFLGKVMTLDSARGTLSRANGSVAAGAGVPLREQHGVLCVQAAVDGGSARWTRMDTGCTAPMVWCNGQDCVRRGGGESVALGWLTGKAVPAEVRVGDLEIQDVPVRLRAEEIYPGEAGLLGNGVLSHKRVTIDGIAKRLVLE